MNYKLHYDKLIERSKNRTLQSYYEKHHIIPKCLGGTDDESNLAELTAREHFVSHLLLCKMYPNNYKLIKAAQMMCVFSMYNKGRSKNRMYEWMKIKFSIAQSIYQSGKNNSQYGTRWVTNGEIEKKIKKNECLMEGWEYGRLIGYETKMKKELSKKQKKIEEYEKRIEKINYFEELHEIYVQYGFEGVECLKNYRYTKPALVQNFKKYVKEFVPQNGKNRPTYKP